MTRDMTTGSPLKRILAFCAPLIAGNLFQQFYNLADSIIVGRLLGVNAFAAVGSTGSLNFLILGFALGMCSGFAIPIAQSFGAGNAEAVRRRTGQVILLGAAFSLGLTLLTAFTTRGILRLVNTPEEIFEDAYRYIFIIFMGIGATILYNLCAGVLRALGDSRTPLVFLIVAVSINIGLDLLFIAGFGMNVEGAACATVLAQAISGLGCVLYIWRRVPMLRLKRSDFRPHKVDLHCIVSIGVPMGLQFSITAIGSTILQSAVNSLGADAVASVTAATRVHLIVSAPLETSGVAMATYCGQNLGAGKLERVRRGVRCMTAVAMIYCVLAFSVNLFAGHYLARLFIDASETEILANVHRFLICNGLAYPELAVIYIFRNSLQGLGFSNAAMLAGIAELTARTLASFAFVSHFGFAAVCFADPLAWVFADGILLPLYFVKMRVLDRRFGVQRK